MAEKFTVNDAIESISDGWNALISALHVIFSAAGDIDLISILRILILVAFVILALWIVYKYIELLMYSIIKTRERRPIRLILVLLGTSVSIFLSTQANTDVYGMIISGICYLALIVVAAKAVAGRI